jgi:hypothetical protein
LNHLPIEKPVKNWFKLNSVSSGELLIEFKAEKFGKKEYNENEFVITEIPNLKIMLLSGKDLLATDSNGKSGKKFF